MIVFATVSILISGVLHAGNKKKTAFVLKGTFYGSVTDAVSKAPIQGVSVYFSDIKTGSSTDANGNFSLKNLPEGKIFFSISYGKNLMGPHASQLSQEERWKIVRYIQELQKL